MPRGREKGFTLIELLIVVVIIGILAAIAIPKFGQTRQKANDAAMKGELRAMLTAQEQYFGDNATYGTETQLKNAGLWVNPKESETVDGAVFGAGSTSLTAILTKGTRKCSVDYFTAGNTSSSTTNGVITCADKP